MPKSNTRKKQLNFLSKLAKEEDTSTYSSTMRDLNKKKEFDKRKIFMKAFKKAFDDAMNQSLDDHQMIALLEAKQEIDA